ncbi:hypothetical protein [uncultured Shimia sp.]|uniref:hypothetical protein n=1 Tax=uncultured Shimia sp. TaxID=573152 RepID=UPI00262EF923|nr:hypothetical protein [uncultured Shimia sp.]
MNMLRAIILFVTVFTLPVHASENKDKLKVGLFHTPASFSATLSAIDDENRIVLPSATWFEPSEVNAWVLFISSDEDRMALPEIALQVVEAVEASPNPLVRVSVDLQNGQSLRVQVNNLAKTSRSVDFQGCLAALDIASVAYGESYVTPENIEVFCSEH